jgi:hypothetical protein
VIVRKLSRDRHVGYAAPDISTLASTGPDRDPGLDPALDPELELLDPAGRLIRIAWDQIKWVCYLRDANFGDGSESSASDRLLRRRFSAKPRLAGVWLRMTLPDGEELEGVAANDRSLIDGIGLLMTPPDTRSHVQRVFVPRTSIQELTVLGVIGTVTYPRRASGNQPGLFVLERDE